MSQTKDEKEFKVKIIVTDEMGSEIVRDYKYDSGVDYNLSIQDMVDTHLENN